MSDKIVLLELNEVPFRVLDEFCARQPRSTLARCLARCQQFETHAEDTGHLSPWITWPSVHRGVTNDCHGIACFGEDLQPVDQRFPPFWQLLAERGISTGVFGSLHSYGSLPAFDSGNYAFYVPDTFAAGSECFPKRLSAYQRFNLAMVEGSPRNVSSLIPWRPALAMLAQAPALGIQARTLFDTGLQVLAERIRSARRVRRRTYQALIAFDVFYRQLLSTRPAFATFFTNHVASAMHRYWAARFPHDYSTFGLGDDWVATYKDEIDFSLRKLDGCLGRLVGFVDRNPEYQLWITTSMGQAATTAEPLASVLYLTNVAEFMRRLRVPGTAWSRRPAMAPDINLVVAGAAADGFEAALQQVTIAERPLEFRRGTGGLFSLRFGQPDLSRHQHYIQLAGKAITAQELGLSNVSIDEQSSTTAYHIPQGMLLIYDPRRAAPAAGRTQISTLDIAPAILRRFAIPVPPYMRSSRLFAAA